MGTTNTERSFKTNKQKQGRYLIYLNSKQLPRYFEVCFKEILRKINILNVLDSLLN